MLAFSRLLFLFSLLFALAPATTWPVVPHTTQENLPNIELSLAPPLHPWPQVAAELGNLEESREHLENGNMAALQREFNKAKLEVLSQIGTVIGKAFRVFDGPQFVRHAPSSATFIQQLPQDVLGSSALSVKVNVLPANPPDAALSNNIEALEATRSDEEKSVLESAVSEVGALKEFVLNELQAQLQEHVAKLVGKSASVKKVHALSLRQARFKQLPSQPNVRVVPTEGSYPTVTSMVQGSEYRRDVAEELERQQILKNELDFLTACNSAIEKALKAAVIRIVQQDGTAKSQ